MMLGYGCTQPLPEAEQQPAGPTIAKDISGISEELPETQPIAEETLPKTEEKPELIVEDKNNFQIFNPVLTYEGAYNGPLYGTSEQVGSASMDSYFENLDRNGINFFIGMFGISGEPTADTLVSDQELGEVIAAAQKHPYRIIPFFNPGIGGEEVEQYLGEELTGMYTKTLEASQGIVGKEFIRGFGEVETQEWSARHNDPKVLQLVTLAQRNNLHFMFHPVAGKMDDVEKIIEAYPDTTFLMHLFREDLAQSTDKLITLLKEHDNLYYSMDAAHIIHDNNMDLIYDYDSPNQQSSIAKLVSAYDSKEKIMTQSAIQAYKPLVDAAPDKVMWGTEIGPEYAFDPQVFDRAIKISRFVIAGFDEKDREAVGYKNALRVFGEGVVADSRIKVLDTRSWPECTDAQMGDCDASCDIPVTNALTAEQEECSLNCFMGKQCREVLEMDVG
ncbi:MAG: amidohydrolase family protein [Nanoarchaeota archaeon]|nr:amidohydrolase family protein [Nanoarchaeota archaeon]